MPRRFVEVGAGFAGMAFLVVCLGLPAGGRWLLRLVAKPLPEGHGSFLRFYVVGKEVRERVRPWVVRQVELGRPWVIWVQQFRPRSTRFEAFARHPMLDRVHLFTANTCGVPTL